MNESIKAMGWKRGPGRSKELVLRYTREGMSPRQIASRLGISTQQVYKHLDRLRDSGDLEEAS